MSQKNIEIIFFCYDWFVIKCVQIRVRTKSNEKQKQLNIEKFYNNSTYYALWIFMKFTANISLKET